MVSVAENQVFVAVILIVDELCVLRMDEGVTLSRYEHGGNEAFVDMIQDVEVLDVEFGFVLDRMPDHS